MDRRSLDSLIQGGYGLQGFRKPGVGQDMGGWGMGGTGTFPGAFSEEGGTLQRDQGRGNGSEESWEENVPAERLFRRGGGERRAVGTVPDPLFHCGVVSLAL